MSQLGTTGLVLTGMTINAVHTIQQKKDPFPSLLAGGVFVVGCSLIGSASPEIGTGIAALYLLSSFLFHGEVFINLLSQIAGQPS